METKLRKADSIKLKTAHTTKGHRWIHVGRVGYPGWSSHNCTLPRGGRGWTPAQVPLSKPWFRMWRKGYIFLDNTKALSHSKSSWYYTFFKVTFFYTAPRTGMS